MEDNQQIEFRNLDGVYFRMTRNGKHQNICFSDMTEEEMDSILNKQDAPWLRQMCKLLGKTLRDIGDQLNIISGDEEEDN